MDVARFGASDPLSPFLDTLQTKLNRFSSSAKEIPEELINSRSTRGAFNRHAFGRFHVLQIFFFDIPLENGTTVPGSELVDAADWQIDAPVQIQRIKTRSV